ncbi:hypothetical protein [Sphingorhabdus sp. YGSMI21]|uniref:hypothetical protein n=2 Tax=Sphingomonadaceae TaxID=41297 RepID=UPI000C59A6E8|nr:hypothetical protein [Sphingorhabdus sp. YGSMI21]ATW04634.1 hypothetical protein CHN51_14630 [Sphingorhabdus sp. YGSMI21]
MPNKLLTKAMDRETSRPLILPDDGLRHSFRRGLPLKIADIGTDKQDSDRVSVAKQKGLGEDVSLFLLSFLAFFTAFYMFIV